MGTRLRIEHWLFTLFVFLLPFQSIVPFRAAGFQLQVADLAFGALLVVWLGGLMSRQRGLQFRWFHLFLAAYLIAVFLSAISSVDPSRSAVKLTGKLYLILIALVAFSLIDSMHQMRRVFYAWLGGAGLVLALSGLGIAAFYMGLTDPEVNVVVHPIYGSLPAGPYPRIEGLFAYPAMFSNFLGVTWMIAIACTLNGWLTERNLWIFGSLLIIVNVFTLTPGLGGIFLSSGIVLFLLKKLKTPVAAGAYLAAGIIAAALFLAAASFTLFSFEQNSVKLPLVNGEVTASHRALAWSTGIQTFFRFPILGKGVGMPVSEAIYTDPNGNNQLLTDAHNTYVSVLAETGLVGAAAFFGMLFFVILKLVRSVPKARWVYICLLLALIDAVFYQGLTGSYEDARHLWVVIGIAAAMGSDAFSTEEKSAETSPDPPAGEAKSS